MATFTDLFTDAATRIRVARAGDVLNPDDAAYLLLLFNSILDSWNADRRAVYSESFTDFTCTPNHSPHTIGPGGDFSVTQRPVSVDAVQLNLGGSPAVYRPIRVRDDAWYQAQPVPGLTQSVPTDCFYSADWPLGNLYFWGIPTAASVMRLWLRVLLTQVSDPTQAFSLPPGYQAALTLTLAKTAAPSFGQSWTASLEDDRREALERIFGNDDDECRIATADAGLTGSTGMPNGFNWRSRTL